MYIKNNLNKRYLLQCCLRWSFQVLCPQTEEKNIETFSNLSYLPISLVIYKEIRYFRKLTFKRDHFNNNVILINLHETREELVNFVFQRGWDQTNAKDFCFDVPISFQSKFSQNVQLSRFSYSEPPQILKRSLYNIFQHAL